MHCPNCGKVVSKTLKYCNDCGERLSKVDEIDKDGMPGKMLDNILTAIFMIVMFGMGILVGLVAVLLSNNIDTEIVLKITVVYLAAIFGICFVLARQVPKLIDARLKMGLKDDDVREPQQLRAPITAQLNEYQQPASSVTDHTTRTLDKIPVKRG